MKAQENSVRQALGGAPADQALLCRQLCAVVWLAPQPFPHPLFLFFIAFWFSSCLGQSLSAKFFDLFSGYFYVASVISATERDQGPRPGLSTFHILLTTMAASLHLGPMVALEPSSFLWFRAFINDLTESHFQRQTQSCTRLPLWTQVSRYNIITPLLLFCFFWDRLSVCSPS